MGLVPALPPAPLYAGMENLAWDVTVRDGSHVFRCDIAGRSATLVVRPRKESGYLDLWRLTDEVYSESVAARLRDRRPSITYKKAKGVFGSVDPADAAATALGVHVPFPEEVREMLRGVGVSNDELSPTVATLFAMARRCGLISLDDYDRAERTYERRDWLN